MSPLSCPLCRLTAVTIGLTGMTRRNKLAIAGVAVVAAILAASVAAVTLREPSMRSKLGGLREGIAYDEVVVCGGWHAPEGTPEGRAEAPMNLTLAPNVTNPTNSLPAR